jgi:1,4-alpha-glucan branching enzyme
MRHQSVIWIAVLCTALGIALGCATPRPGQSPTELRAVTFHFEGRARSVCIVGDFNQWTHESHCLQPSPEGRWSIGLQLPPGPFHYAFVVDGQRWILDPKALFVESDGFGRQNSVAMIE